MTRRAVLRWFVAAWCVWAAAAVHAQWPEFRGPTGQGHSTERGLPLSWSETQNVIWKQPVPGRGWSSPVVAGGQIWLTTAVETRDGASLRAMAFGVENGAVLHDVEIFRTRQRAATNAKNSLASPTAILSGDRVYVHFGLEGTAALTTSGTILWKARFTCDTQHGSGGSPVLYQQLLIVACDGYDVAYLVAVDVATGRTKWKTERRSPFSQAYATPLLIRAGDRDLVVSPGAFRAGAYDPATGREVWRVSYDEGFSNVPRPVFGDDLVYIATGFNQPSLMAVRVDGSGDVTETHVAWRLTRGAPFTPSPIFDAGILYFVSDIGVASAVDARTGDPIWQQRLGGNYSASPVLADGRLYFQSEEGLTTVIEPGRTFRRLATAQVDGATLASMAVADGSLYLRTQSHLYRIGQR